MNIIDKIINRHHRRKTKSKFTVQDLYEKEETNEPIKKRKKRRRKKHKKTKNPFDLFLRKWSQRKQERIEKKRKEKARKRIRAKHRRERLDRDKRKELENIKLIKSETKKRKKKSRVPHTSERLENLKEKYKLFAIVLEIIQKNVLKKNYHYIFNSTLIFIISYIIVYFIYQLTVILSASLFNIDSILYYFTLDFDDFSPLWSRLNVIFITFSGPFISLVIGLFLFNYLFKLKRFKSLQKLFILWISLHAFNHFAGALILGIVTTDGFGYVVEWLYLGIVFKFILIFIAFFILIIIGYQSTSKFLSTSNSLDRVRVGVRNTFLFNQAFLPWILGSLILIIIRIPNNFNYPYETLMFFSLAFIVIPVFFNDIAKPHKIYKKIRRKYSLNIGYIILFLLLLTAFRIGLDNGLHFIITIDFSFNVVPL
jgi:hypothetical protein